MHMMEVPGPSKVPPPAGASFVIIAEHYKDKPWLSFEDICINGTHDGDLHLPPHPTVEKLEWAIPPKKKDGQVLLPGELLRESKVRSAIRCVSCGKHRAIFTNYKPNKVDIKLIQKFVEDMKDVYHCGADMTAAADSAGLANTLIPYTRLHSGQNISAPFTCKDFMEGHLYATEEFKFACSVCGTLESPPALDRTVFPLCVHCRNRGYNESKSGKKKDMMAIPVANPVVPAPAAAAAGTAVPVPAAAVAGTAVPVPAAAVAGSTVPVPAAAVAVPAVPVPAAGTAVPVPAVPVPAAGTAVPVPAAGTAVPVPAAGTAVPVPAAAVAGTAVPVPAAGTAVNTAVIGDDSSDSDSNSDNDNPEVVPTPPGAKRRSAKQKGTKKKAPRVAKKASKQIIGSLKLIVPVEIVVEDLADTACRIIECDANTKNSRVRRTRKAPSWLKD
jgi:hypothetical protein